MKKWILALTLFVCLHSNAQTCEQKENRFLQALGGLSASTLYNTYGIIGAISDAYAKGAYDPKMVEELMTAQQTLVSNLVVMLDSMLKDNIFTAQADRDFILSSLSIFDNLKEQAALMSEYARTSSSRTQDAYEEKRKQNWSAISKLMGLKD